MSSSRPTTTNTDNPVAENARSNERALHAEGGGAFGFFEVTEDVSQFTRAAVFQPGTTTETLVRFSSSDIPREPLGTAIRFRTSEGDYDLVGANTPVCVVRDPSDLPNSVRWWPGRADDHLRDNDERWDFWTRHPDSAHQVTWLMGDRGLPATWRHTNLHGVHTYLWTNAAGERFWVKYHFRTAQGHEFLSQDEADRPAGAEGDHHLRDLRTAVESGEYPEWTLYVQVMPFEDAVDYRFDPFDATKVWPHADHPLIEVGRLVLNRNPDDHFARIEQAAFDPSNMVPGIGASPDRVLRARLFSYSENGPMSFDFGQGDIEQEVIRAASTPHADDDFGQAGTLVREVFDDAERARFVDNVAGHLLGGVSRPVLDRALEYWRNVDKATGDRIAEKVGGD